MGKTYITSLVIDRICGQARARTATAACCYFNCAAQKELSPTTILSSTPQELVGRLENIPIKIVEAFQDQEIIGRRRLELRLVIDMLQDILSSRSNFLCVDALNVCVAEYRGKLPESKFLLSFQRQPTSEYTLRRIHPRKAQKKKQKRFTSPSNQRPPPQLEEPKGNR